MTTMFYALSAAVASVLPALALMLWVSYLEERDLVRPKGFRGFWFTTIVYASGGIGLILLSVLVGRVLVSPFI